MENERGRRQNNLGALMLLQLGALLAATQAGAIDPAKIAPTGDVADFVGVLRPSVRQAILGRLRALDRSATGTLRVVIVDTTEPMDEMQFARQVAEAWRALGDPSVAQKVLLLAVVDKRNAHAVVGKTLADVLSEKAVGDIVEQEMLSELRAGRTGEAIWRGVYAIADRIVAVRPNADWSIPPEGFDARSVWKPEKEPTMDQCEPQPAGTFAPWLCLGQLMRKGGASKEAIAFAKQGFGYMGSFEEKGVVDCAVVRDPFVMSGDMNWALVNGNPSVVQVADIWNPDSAIAHDALYPALHGKYPRMMIWTIGQRFLGSQTRSAGGQRFLFAYPLLNGCHACELVGHAEFAFDFDAAGRLRAVSLLKLTSETPLS